MNVLTILASACFAQYGSFPNEVPDLNSWSHPALAEARNAVGGPAARLRLWPEALASRRLAGALPPMTDFAIDTFEGAVVPSGAWHLALGIPVFQPTTKFGLALRQTTGSREPVRTSLNTDVLRQQGGAIGHDAGESAAIPNAQHPMPNGAPTAQVFATKSQVKQAVVVAEPAAMAPEERLCSVNVSDLDVSTIVRQLSSQTKINLMLLTDPKTKLTMQLTQVPFKDVLHHICAFANISYLKVGKIYVLAPAAQLKTSYPSEYAKANPLEDKPAKEAPTAAQVESATIITKVYHTNYINSSQLADGLKKLFTEDKLTLLAGPASSNPSVASQSSSSSSGGGSSSTGQTSVIAANSDQYGKTLVLRGTRENIDAALAIISELDVARPQVSIAVSIYDISNDAVKDLGVDWTFGSVTINELPTSHLGFGSFARSPLSFTSQIIALQTANKAKLLAAPNISVLDGERGFILIGDRINFPVLVGYSANNAPIFDKQEERVGIYLQVAAAVGSDGSITLSLYPQVSTVSGFLNVNGASYPQISTREAQTTIRLGSGETFVMGGLLRDEEIAQISSVPILSQIPFLGELFKHRKITKNQSQVLISITPILMQSKPK